MKKYFIFNLSNEIKKEEFIKYVNVVLNEINLVFIDEKQGYIYCDNDFNLEIKNILNALSQDLGIEITTLEAYEINVLTKYVFNKQLALKPGSFFTLSEMIMILSLNNDYSFYEYLEKAFINIDSQTINTVSELIKNNSNINKTSKKLFIHRNTLYYRLDDFINKTNLDVRDYDNAQLFILYINIHNHLGFMR